MPARYRPLAWSYTRRPYTHLVITAVLDGQNVIWKKKVTLEQYLGKKDGA
ncbi:MAG: hypothetical protein ACWGOX_13805 [Desulforhopalus sp.]